MRESGLINLLCLGDMSHVLGRRRRIGTLQRDTGVGVSFTGNSWGECEDGEEGQLGCGPQEIFRNCADVAIVTNTAGFPPMPEVRRREGEPAMEEPLANNDIFDLVSDKD